MKTFQSANVLKHGGTLIVPTTMTYGQASEVLAAKAKEEEALTEFSEVIDGFVFDAAYAWQRAIQEVTGVLISKVVQTMFGPVYPEFMSVPTGPNEGDKVSVLWGTTMFPFAESDKEVMNCGVTKQNGRFMFKAQGIVRKKHLGVLSKVADRARELVMTDSIYRGKAIRVEFTDADGDPIAMLTPQFIDLSKVRIEDVVYSRDIEEVIHSYVMTPLIHTQACRDAKIPLKRGILAAGPYGTGKSVLAQVVAKVGTEKGWTYIYIRNSKELAMALRFAQLYQPCIVFAEDLDRAVSGQDRTEDIDDILNTLDGVDSKNSEVMTILTTNHLDQVNNAMRRPGRLDVVLNILPPNAEAAERLIKTYGRGRLMDSVDLGVVGQMLDGQTPAVIREVVERAKLASIGRTGEASALLSDDDLRVSALTMLQQLNLLQQQHETPRGLQEVLHETIVSAVRDASQTDVKDTASAVKMALTGRK